MEWFYSVVNFDMNFVLVRQKIPNNNLSFRKNTNKKKKKPKKKKQKEKEKKEEEKK